MTYLIQGRNGTLVRDSWGFPEAVVSGDTGRPFPTKYEDVCDLLRLAQKHVYVDASRKVDVVTKTAGKDDAELVVLRFQGYLGDFTLSRLGNWDGTISKCMSASIEVYLEPGVAKHEDQWTQHWNTVQNLRTWSYTACRSKSLNVEPRGMMDSIKCHKRVFTKAGRGAPDNVINRNDDYRFPKLASVSNSWVPEDYIVLGVRLSNGKVRRAEPTVFQRGDFVEVAVSVDIVDFPSEGGVKTFLRLEQVLQLASVSDGATKAIRALGHPGDIGVVLTQRKANNLVSFEEDDEVIHAMAH